VAIDVVNLINSQQVWIILRLLSLSILSIQLEKIRRDQAIQVSSLNFEITAIFLFAFGENRVIEFRYIVR
jgi:hypothetical protein